jgi:uncharacterized protein YyaL (SSP411 family)
MNEPTDAEKLRKKELHRRSMVWTGAMTMASGLAAAYLAFSGGGDLPSWMYGRLRPASAPAQPPVRRSAPGLVAWRSWDAALLREAKTRDRLMLLDLRSFWSRSAQVMEETTYADPAVADWISRSVLPVRVDSDERPDLALRYLAGGWPTTALLLPTGEVLDSATVLSPGQFLPWARKLEEAFHRRRAAVMDAAGSAAESRRGRETVSPLEGAALDRALAGLWSGPPFFPRFESAAHLRAAGRVWELGLGQRLEDPIWGGFFRYAAGPGWSIPEREKRLEEQAGALLAGARRERTWDYAASFLSAPKAGFYAAQAPEVRRPDGHVVEGDYYYSLSDVKRRAFGLPSVDKRLFVGDNALMVTALLASPELPKAARERALRTLDLLEREGLRAGLALRKVGGGQGGFLQDQVRLARALTAAGRKEKAAVLLKSARKALAAPGAPALYDRPALGELPEGLDRLLVPQLNAELLLVLQEMDRPEFNDWELELRLWIAQRGARVDPALWRRLRAAPTRR